MSVKEISESLDSLPDRLAALLDSKSPGGGEGFRGKAGMNRPPSVYEMTPDVYGLKEDAGHPDRAPPKAPWGDEADVYQTQPKAKSKKQQYPEDAWRNKFNLPGTSLGLGNFAADFVSGARETLNERLGDRTLDADTRTGALAKAGMNQEGDHSDARDREAGQSNEEDERQLVEALKELKEAVEKNTSALESSGGKGGGGGNDGPGLGEIMALAKFAGS